MNIRPVTNDAEHAAALAKVDDLLGVQRGTPAFDELDAILTLVDSYERRRWPSDGSQDPIDLLKYTIAEVGRTRAELIELVGSASRASEILSKKRALTLDMIRAISEAWGIPIKLLSAPYELNGAASADSVRRKTKRAGAKARTRALADS